MKTLTTSLLALVPQPYDEYNAILPQIKEKLAKSDIVGKQRVQTFETVLAEELPLTTARRAYRTAICIAMGEDEGFLREFKPKTEQKPNGKPAPPKAAQKK